MAMCLVISLGVIGILAVRTLNMKIGGNITFNAEGIAFTVGEGKFYEDDATTIYTGISSQTGKMQGFSMDTDTKLTDVSEAIATWTELELGLDNRGDAILKFNVSNDMSDKELYMVFEISYDDNVNENMKIVTGLLQTIPADDDKDIEIKFDILDMELNAGLENFEIKITFTDKVEVNNAGEVTNNTTPALTNVAYDITDEDSKEVSASMASQDISGAVVIPEKVIINEVEYTVTSIPTSAFEGCENITSVFIPSTVKTVESSAFNSSGLLEIQLSEGLEIIEDNAFAYTLIYGELNIPNSVTSIGNNAFELAGEESEIFLRLGTNLETIGARAFSTPGIKGELIIPGKVKTIGEYAFNSNKVSDLYISKSVISIGEGVFAHNEVLENITVETGNTVYHSAGNCLIETKTGTLIRGCNNSVIPSDGSVKIIARDSFHLSKIKEIYIPKSVTKIDILAFSENSYLEKIVVENGNTKYYSVDNCLIETATKRLIKGCKNSVVPNDIKIIAGYAFSGNNITTITLPESVVEIEYNAVNCYGGNLTKLIIKATNVPQFTTNEIEGSWGLYIGDYKLYVPAESLNAYKAYFSYFKDNIFPIS